MINYYSYNNPLTRIRTKVSYKARCRIFNLFMETMKPEKSNKILDLGVTPDQKLTESNFFEKMYPYPDSLTIASVEDCEFLVSEYKLKSFVKNNPGERLPFSDEEFDILFSNAVIEHVGDRADQKFFLKECCRVAKQVFVTTPNRYFPIEMHTFIPLLHWLPRGIFQKIVKIIKGKDGEFWANTNHLNLLSKRDIMKMGGLEVGFIRTLGFKSNLIIMKKSG